MRHKTTMLLLALLFSFGLFAAETAAPITVNLKQSDGSAFKAKPKGNYYVSWMETLDGHTIVETNGDWYYAQKDPGGTLIAGPNRVGSLSPDQLNRLPQGLRPDADPSKYEKHVRTPRDIANLGTVTQKVLLLLVSYTDISFNYTASSFDTLMFGASSSVKDFYLKNSYNNFVISPASETQGTSNDGIIEVSIASAHPNPGQTTTTSRTAAIAAVTAADSFIDYSSFDTNSDGSISASELSIVVILAGYENSFGGNSAPTPKVWGHKSSFSSTTLDGVALSPYTMFGERHGTSTSSYHQATIGIMCHELGHLMLGLPDIYDRDSSSAGCGDWALMAGGSWNNTGSFSGDSPAHMTSWSKLQSGFTTADDISTSTSGVTIAPASTTSSIKRIWVDPYKAGEYFLLDNRQQDSYDSGLPGSGLLILHIDDNVGTQNDDESHKLVDVEAADGLTEMDSNTNQGNSGDPYPGSTNNTTFNDSSTPNSKDYDNAATNAAVTNIATALNARLGTSSITADLAPASVTLKDHISYDENGVSGASLSYSIENIYTGIRFTNDTTDMDTLDGMDLYWSHGSATSASIEIRIYSSLTNGVLGTLLHTETGFTASVGWNRFLLATPQSFPQGEDLGVVIRINVSGSTASAYYDSSGSFSGRCYLDSNGTGTFTLLSSFGDLNQRALLSSNCGAAPSITSQPSTATTCEGDQVSFSVTASGTSLTYQWRKDGGNISGATSSTYTIASPTTSDAGSYTCVVTDNCSATVTSSAATLTVNTDTSISSQPSGATACPGDNVTFSVTAAGTSLTYQWLKNGQNISGATSSSYTITGVSASDADTYACFVSGTCGNVTSSSATLTVNTTTAISSQPQTQTVCEGNSTTFTVSAAGTSLTYQWRKDGQNISGATSSSYTISSPSSSDAADYTCVVSGSCGSETSSAATLTVNPTTAVTSQPSSQSACPGSSVTFTVAASGASLTYQWRKDGQDISGATAASYTLNKISASDAADYTCAVSGSCGSATSNAAALTVNTNPSISSQPQAQTVCSGDNAGFSVTASGTSLTYQWRKDGQNISGATSSSYSITGVDSGDAGDYDCVVDSACGSTTSSAVALTLETATAISSQPTTQTACPGDSVSLTVTASGASLTYQWRKDGQDISGATSATYAIASASSSDAASYTCVVSGTCGNVTSSAATLTVNQTTSIDSQPQAQTACSGDNVTFTVSASGTSLTYQWRKDGGDISGATSASYALTGVSSSDAASYTCVVSGSCGSSTSSAATLTVNESVAVTAQPQTTSVCVGDALNLSVTATGSSLTYQWRKDGQNISGATSSTYAVGSAATDDAGAYDCVIGSACGSTTTSQAAVTVNPTTAVTSQPQSQTVCESSAVTFTVTVTGGSLTYQWRKDGQDISGATASSYTLASAASGDAGSYTCVISGACGNATSDAATLTVNEGAAITSQPQSATVCAGTQTSFSISATGSGLTYQWRKDGQDISGATSTTYTLAAPTTGDTGAYTCVITASCGTVTSATADLTVNETTAVTSQPQAQTVCESSSVTFTVSASGASLTYQWRKDGGDISGATAASYTIASAATGDAGAYTCVVTGACGTETSSAATLTVNEGAAITAQPQDATVCTGDAATLSVTATGTGLTYQWQKNGQNISGATSATYAIAKTASGDAGTYACVITASCGAITSSSATLTVNETTSITSQPQAQTVCESSSVTFTVVASGTTLTYQWRKDGQDIAGATAASYTLASAATGDSGDYTCVVTGACGNATSSTAALTVNEGAAITAQPQDATVCAGDATTLSVTATGSGLTYQWQKDGQNISGATSSSYAIAAADDDDAGAYACVITASCGAITSSTATLTVNQATTVTSQPQAQTVCESSTVTFTVSASGTSLTYQWRKDGQDIAGATATSYAIQTAAISDSGDYTCVVTGACGSETTATAALTVNEGAAITAQPQDTEVCAGDAATLSVTATGSGLSYQWQKDGQDISGATSSSYAVAAAASGDAGAYACVITAACGAVTSSVATLTVNQATAITSQPQAQTVCESAAVTFTVGASGTSLTYQWRKDGQDIAGATAASYAISSAATGDSGTYTCVVTGACGSQTSSAADLTVNPGATITAQPSGGEICAGADFTFSVNASGDGLTYQWQKDGGDIAGATSATLSLTGAATTDSGSYACIITADCGALNSASAQLTVNPATAVTSQPQDQTVCSGSAVTMTVAADGAGLSYQWRKDGQDIAGATAASYTIAAVVEGDAGSYTCAVTGTCGTATSNAATLTIDNDISITSQPQNADHCTGETAAFTVVASGAGLTYQWRKDGQNITGATSATLTLTQLATTDAGAYDCIITGGCGSSTSAAAQLTVNQGAQITSQPQGGNLCEGASFTVSLTVEGSATFQWRKDGQDIAGATAATYTIASVVLADSGDYTCVVTSACGPTTSAAATLDVQDGPPTITGNPANVDICVGNPAQFTVTATGANLTYQWRKGDQDIAGATAATYTIAQAQISDAGAYTCVVANGCSSQTSTAGQLTVDETLSITAHPDSREACPGTSFSLITAAVGSNLSYRWYKDGQQIPNVTSSTLVIFDADATDAGDYYCEVSDSCSVVSSDIATVIISDGPDITQQPAPVSACIGETVTFNVTASGAGLTYQWRRNGVNILGATQATLTVGPVVAGNAGDYLCIVSDDCGDLSSESATLSILPQTSITADPVDVQTCAGETVTFSVTAANAEDAFYQWLLNGQDIPGATQATLTLVDVGVNDQGAYSCLVSGICNDVTSGSALLQLEAGPQITTHPNSRTECEGDEVTLFAFALGSPVSYQWRRDGQDLPGATGNFYAIPMLTPAETGTYTCIITGECGQAQTNPAVVAIGSDGISANAWSVNTSLGSLPIRLRVDIDCGIPEYSYTWSILGGEVVGTDSTYLINPNDLTQTTTFQVDILDADGGTASDTHTILVNPSGTDPDGDGNNDLDDLILVAQEWTQNDSIYDANNDGILDIRDLLFINTGNDDNLAKQPN